MKETFESWRPIKRTKALLQQAMDVVEDYQAQGYALTLRQLYYQLVARDLIPNNDKQYKSLGDMMRKARLSGLVDWNAIVDRGRTPQKPPEWASPGSIIESAAYNYRLDRWQGQEYKVEVWCEKDALSSVLEPVCNRFHVTFMANRGYSSTTAMYDASKRMLSAIDGYRTPVIIYLGDHDPSGLDMSRDIEDRIGQFTYHGGVRIERLALNYDQVEEYQPPPNPTKTTDSRAAVYIEEFGNDSWELDALEPQVLDALVSERVEHYLDRELYEQRLVVEEEHKAAIRAAGEGLEY